MTAPDVRTAAQAEAGVRYIGDPDDHALSPAFAELRREGFVAGAVWGAALALPTREQIAEVIDAHADIHDGIDAHATADAVLALIRSGPKGG